MSVPLDRLYHYLKSLIDYDTVIYHWVPHGSRNLENLEMLSPRTLFSQFTVPLVVMHDQEILQYDYYDSDRIVHCKKIKPLKHGYKPIEINSELIEFWKKLHLRAVLSPSLYPTIITHSELQSHEVEKYQENGYITCYYWAHGMIAKDWYRFANHDLSLQFQWGDFNSDFLIYNRAWSGTREYRLKFSELLIEFDLLHSCKTSFSPICNNTHYTDYDFCNKKFRITRYDLHDFYEKNTSSATSSADYSGIDYAENAIEIVLETLFDDDRLHLTEKSIRPIACGKPFILTAPAGSLKYLRDYGFLTFHPLIDETYDSVKDPYQRLIAVVKEMKRIQSMPLLEKKKLFVKLHTIAQHNKQRFFSIQFDQHLVSEFVNNMATSLEQCKNQISMDTIDQWLLIRKKYAPEAYQEIVEHYDQLKTISKIL